MLDYLNLVPFWLLDFIFDQQPSIPSMPQPPAWNQLFTIFPLTEAEVRTISAAPDPPHYHDYEELLIGMEGQMEHFIDFKRSTLQAPFISFVTKGKIHRVVPKELNGRCQMWVLRFKSEFIAETTFQLYAHYHDHANLTLPNGPSFERMVSLCVLIYETMQEPTPDLAVVRHLLNALLAMVEAERQKTEPNGPGQLSSQNTTFKNFLTLLEDNFRRPVGVEFYADKLFMSPRNLNLICRQTLQKSVSEIIEARKLVEAKNLLASTDKTIAEIGYELGYQEKAYFTAVFKKRAGVTPSSFRAEMRRMTS